jgi:hypothetical protein
MASLPIRYPNGLALFVFDEARGSSMQLPKNANDHPWRCSHDVTFWYGAVTGALDLHCEGLIALRFFGGSEALLPHIFSWDILSTRTPSEAPSESVG